MDVDTPGHRLIYPPHCICTSITTVVAIVGVLLAIATVANLLAKPTLTRRVIGLVVWVLFPPIWFWAEYFLLYKPYGLSGTFEQFKYGQDASAKVWAGIVALLTADLIRSRTD